MESCFQDRACSVSSFSLRLTERQLRVGPGAAVTAKLGVEAELCCGQAELWAGSPSSACPLQPGSGSCCPAQWPQTHLFRSGSRLAWFCHSLPGRFSRSHFTAWVWSLTAGDPRAPSQVPPVNGLQKTRARFICWGLELEKEMATHSSILAWRILWTEEPSGLLSVGSHRVRHDWSDLACMHACIGEGNGNPLQYSCLKNPRDRGAWLAAVYGVVQSRTRLKWLSSSSSSRATELQKGCTRMAE